MPERNHEITEVQSLLKEDGTLREPGWSRFQAQQYDRRAIKAPGFRIKEWDYYLVTGDDFAAAFTISDLSYLAMISVSYLDLKEKWEHTETIIRPFSFGSLKLPGDSSEKGKISYHDKKVHLEYKIDNGTRRIRCDFPKFHGERSFSCDILLTQPDMDTMVIATPWSEDPQAFYYNQKINCMPARGWVKYDDQKCHFHPGRNFGILDWGRGVWTYKNTWYWGIGNGLVDGKTFGFNIGYGFGDTTAASENILYYDGSAHKLDDITFHIPEDDYEKPWKITSSDGRFEMDFIPILDRAATTNALVIKTVQHQVFGKMNGQAILDDGTVLEVRDLLCACEKVMNKY